MLADQKTSIFWFFHVLYAGSAGSLYIDNIAGGALSIVNIQLDDVLMFPAVSLILTAHVYCPFRLSKYIEVGTIPVAVNHDE